MFEAFHDQLVCLLDYCHCQYTYLKSTNKCVDLEQINSSTESKLTCSKNNVSMVIVAMNNVNHGKMLVLCFVSLNRLL